MRAIQLVSELIIGRNRKRRKREHLGQPVYATQGKERELLASTTFVLSLHGVETASTLVYDHCDMRYAKEALHCPRGSALELCRIPLGNLLRCVLIEQGKRTALQEVTLASLLANFKLRKGRRVSSSICRVHSLIVEWIKDVASLMPKRRFDITSSTSSRAFCLADD